MKTFARATLQVRDANNPTELIFYEDSECDAFSKLGDHFTADEAAEAFKACLSHVYEICMSYFEDDFEDDVYNVENGIICKRVIDALDNEKDAGRTEFDELIVFTAII